MKIVLAFFLFTSALIANAQTESLKIGYADVTYILKELPATKKADAELKSLQTQLGNQFDIKQQEFDTKYADYLAAEKNQTMSSAVQMNTRRELEMLKANLDRFDEDAQATLQRKQEELLNPIYKIIGDAIAEVAKENGFTFILNPKVGGFDIVLYGDEKWDVSDLVLKKLGVTPKVAANISPVKN
jgi:outer membrane protein